MPEPFIPMKRAHPQPVMNDAGMYSRTPPQNIDAEMAVLGAMLLGDRSAIEVATEVLRSEDFYREAHAHIYESMVTLNEKDEPVDIVTLKDELSRRSNLEAMGGVAYLMALADFVPTTANVGHYARIVREEATRRRLIETGAQIAALGYNEAESVDDLVDCAETLAYDVGRGRQIGQSVSMQQGLKDSLDALEERYHAGNKLLGVTTGFKDADFLLNGLRRGHLVILAARPAIGKSGLAGAIGLSAAKSGARVVVFSLEMSQSQWHDRLICSEGRVDTHAFDSGRQLGDDGWRRVVDAASQLHDLPHIIIDQPGMSVSAIRACCRRERPDLVIVDYLQLLSISQAPGNRQTTRAEEVSAFARGLKETARMIDCPVLALAQVNRAVESRADKRPMLSDLAESGGIEAAADVVMFLHREDAFAPDRGASKPHQISEVIIGKNRHGPTGLVKLLFTPRFVRFDNLDHNHDLAVTLT